MSEATTTMAAEMPSMNNKSFARMVTSIRKVLPQLAAALLATVYIVSAISTGQLLAKLIGNNMAGAFWVGLAIGFGIQMTRGLLVFFPQLNPNRPTFGYWGEAVAIIMGVISIGEVVSLVGATHLHPAVAFSISVLMAAGMGIEIYLLKEVRFYTEMELFRNAKWWDQLQNYYRARRDFKKFLDKLQEEEDNDSMSSTLPAGTETRIPGSRRLAKRYSEFSKIAEEKSSGGGAESPLDLDPARLNLELA
jgi:hypothetical protein